jgi:hypothetical protein
MFKNELSSSYYNKAPLNADIVDQICEFAREKTKDFQSKDVISTDETITQQPQAILHGPPMKPWSLQRIQAYIESFE